MAWLIVTSGQSAGQAFSLDKCPVTIGRDVTQDIQLLDLKVSKKHAAVRREADNYLITENNAKNGVYVNGERTAETALKDGDRLTMGQTHMIFRNQVDPAEINALKRERVMSKESRQATQI